jgi:hypothetical protein
MGGIVRKLLVALAGLLLCGAGMVSADASAGVHTYTVVHNKLNQTIETACHTSASHAGVRMHYCLKVGVTNQAGSLATYDYLNYAVSMWCTNTSGAVVHCRGAKVDTRVVTYNRTVHDVISCGTYGGLACPPAGRRYHTGWLGTGTSFSSPRGTGVQCTPQPNMQSQARSAAFNGHAVVGIATHPWIVCDHT